MEEGQVMLEEDVLALRRGDMIRNIKTKSVQPIYGRADIISMFGKKYAKFIQKKILDRKMGKLGESSSVFLISMSDIGDWHKITKRRKKDR
jgi:hypothetical protein